MSYVVKSAVEPSEEVKLPTVSDAEENARQQDESDSKNRDNGSDDRYDNPNRDALYLPLEHDELLALTSPSELRSFNFLIPCYGPNRIGEKMSCAAAAWRVIFFWFGVNTAQYAGIAVWMHSCFSGDWRIVVPLSVTLAIIDSIPMISMGRNNSNPLMARILRDVTFMAENRQQATKNCLGFIIMLLIVFMPFNIVFCVPTIIKGVPVMVTTNETMDVMVAAHADAWALFIAAWLGMAGLPLIPVVCWTNRYNFFYHKYVQAQATRFANQYADDVVSLLLSEVDAEEANSNGLVLDRLQQKQLAMLKYWDYYCQWMGTASVIGPFSLLLWAAVSAFMIVWDPSSGLSVGFGLALASLCLAMALTMSSGEGPTAAARAHGSIRRRILGAHDYHRALDKFHGSKANLDAWLDGCSTTLRVCGILFNTKLMKQFQAVITSVVAAALVRLLLSRTEATTQIM